jgi:hypothetical protein
LPYWFSTFSALNRDFSGDRFMPAVHDAAFTDLNVPLSRRVAESLLAHDADAYRQLNVAARGDVVFLSGLAVGEDARDAAVEIVRGIAGVSDVVDRVLVRPYPPRPTVLNVPAALAASDDAWRGSVTPLALFGLLFALVAWQWTSILRAELSGHEAPTMPASHAVAAVSHVR